MPIFFQFYAHYTLINYQYFVFKILSVFYKFNLQNILNKGWKDQFNDADVSTNLLVSMLQMELELDTKKARSSSTWGWSFDICHIQQ